MADNIDRQHIINTMEWIEAEQEEINRKSGLAKMSSENIRLKMEMEKQKCIALSEMYGTMVRANREFPPRHGIKLCHLAKAMVYLCYKLDYIDSETNHRLTDHLDYKIKKYNEEEQADAENE